MPPPALEQLFTLPFALHLNPLPTLEYRVVSKDSEESRAARKARSQRKREERQQRQRQVSGRALSPLGEKDQQGRRPSASILSPLNQLRRKSASSPADEEHPGASLSAQLDRLNTEDAVTLEEEEDEADDSDDRDEEDAPDGGRTSFDLAGGASRLEPVHTEWPPHSLDTISMLLEQTEVLQSIEALSKAIKLLDRASEIRSPATRTSRGPRRASAVSANSHLGGATSDAAVETGSASASASAARGDEVKKDVSFSKLRAFFDARYNVDYQGGPLDAQKPLFARLDANTAAGPLADIFHDQLHEEDAASSTGAGSGPAEFLRRTFSPPRSSSFASSTGGTGLMAGTLASSATTPGPGSPEQIEGASSSGFENLGRMLSRGGSSKRKDSAASGSQRPFASLGSATGGSLRKQGRGRGRKYSSAREAQLREAHSVKVVQAQENDAAAGAAANQKDVYFNVRLDLHNAGLAATPPRVKEERALLRQRKQPRIALQGQSPPRTRSMTNQRDDRQSFSLQPTDKMFEHREGAGFSGGDNLQQVLSAESLLSVSAASDSNPSSGGNHGQGAGERSGVPILGARGPRTTTTAASSAGGELFEEAAGAAYAGSSPPSSDMNDGSQFSGVADPKDRRPSFLQRVLDLGFRNPRTRSASGVSSAADSQFSGFNGRRERSNSAASNEGKDALHPSGKAQAQLAPAPTRSRAQAGSFGSASARLGARSQLQETTNLGSVQEGAVLDDGDHSDVFSTSDLGDAEDEWEALQGQLFMEGEDFISLLRQASSAAVTILQTVTHNGADDTASPGSIEKGKRPMRSPLSVRSPDSAATPRSEIGMLTPPDSIEMERRHEEQRNAFNLAEHVHGGWPEGPVDPSVVAVAAALGDALGWEGIMSLCYGPASRCSRAGEYIALGRAATMHESTKDSSASVLAWRSSVAASAEASPEYRSGRLPAMEDADQMDTDLERLDPEARAEIDRKIAEPLGWLKKWTNKAFNIETPEQAVEESSEQETQDRGHRTWQDWLALFRSISGWVDAYEQTRVQAGLAPECNHEKSFAGWLVSQELNSNVLIPSGTLKDLVRPAHAFRRREGIPEALPAGPDGKELPSYRWSRQYLDARHFYTPLTLLASSLSQQVLQISEEEWPYTSAWELDYLEACVFHSPIIAHRFPPPGFGAVSPEQSFQPEGTEQRRANLCPMPSETGAWDSLAWKRWLSLVREGQILVPAVTWQAWWTLISILNGADRSGRSYDLQVKSYEEPFEVLKDLSNIYL